MLQIIQQTREERIAMYMKMTKREIVEMLLNNQDAVSIFQQGQSPAPRGGGLNVQW